MSPSVQHATIIAFESKLKTIKLEFLPLDLDIINETLNSVNLVLSKSMFLYWCKKCWNYLECAAHLSGDLKDLFNSS